MSEKIKSENSEDSAEETTVHVKKNASNEESKPEAKEPSTQEVIDKLKNDYLYLRAEFDNYRRHVVKERSDLQKYASEKVLHDLLGIIDNFDMALSFKLTQENMANYTKGVEMISKELRALLNKNGVVEMKSDGEPFDPNLHEALTNETSAEIPPGHVLRTFKKGYRLHEKLIRPAQVVVSKKA